MDRVKELLVENFTGISVLAVAGVFAGLTVLISGCSLADLIRVRVPRGVQSSLHIEPTVRLSEAGVTWERWQSFVELESRSFNENIDRSAEVAGLIGSLMNMGLEVGSGPLTSLPGGAFFLASLTGLGGLFLRTPGTSKRVAKEKEASYNKGLERGRRLTSGGA